MKKLYEFVVSKEEIVKESETSKNDKGEEVTTTKEVKKQVEKELYLRKPTRKLFDEAELYYGVKLAEGIKEGLLTRALLQKRFSNDGGTLGDKEKEEWGKLYSEVFDKQVEMQQILIKDKKDRSEEEVTILEDGKEFIRESRNRIQEFEMQQSSLYDQTAENRARNKTILWWVLHLAHNKNGDSPFFGEGGFDEKIRAYDKMEEAESEFEAECINKFFYYVSFWYVSKTSDPEHFKQLIDFAEKEDLMEENDKEEPTKEENVQEDKAAPVVEEEPVEEEPVEEEPVEEELIEEEKKEGEEG
jgi:hypothetical protein